MANLGYKHIKSGTYARVYRKGQSNKVLRVCSKFDFKPSAAWFNFISYNPSKYYIKVFATADIEKSESKSEAPELMVFTLLEYLKPLTLVEEKSLFERLEKGSNDKDSFEYAYSKCKDACKRLPFKMDVIDFNMYGIVENVMKRKDGTYVITDPWK